MRSEDCEVELTIVGRSFADFGLHVGVAFRVCVGTATVRSALR